MFYHATNIHLIKGDKLNGNLANKFRPGAKIYMCYLNESIDKYCNEICSNILSIESQFQNKIIDKNTRDTKMGYVMKESKEGFFEWIRKKHNFEDKPSRLECCYLYDDIEECKKFAKDSNYGTKDFIYKIVVNENKFFYSNIQLFNNICDELHKICKSNNSEWENIIHNASNMADEYFKTLTNEIKKGWEIIVPDGEAKVVSSAIKVK